MLPGDKIDNHLDLRSKSENATCARVDVIAARSFVNIIYLVWK